MHFGRVPSRRSGDSGLGPSITFEKSSLYGCPTRLQMLSMRYRQASRCAGRSLRQDIEGTRFRDRPNWLRKRPFRNAGVPHLTAKMCCSTAAAMSGAKCTMSFATRERGSMSRTLRPDRRRGCAVETHAL